MSQTGGVNDTSVLLEPATTRVTASQVQPALQGHVLRLRLRTLAKATVSLPLAGFLFCIVSAFFFKFKNSTYTHCEVYNFAPSISASIGYKPQKYAWQLSVALHAQGRFLFGVLVVRRLAGRIIPTRLNKVCPTPLYWPLYLTPSFRL